MSLKARAKALHDFQNDPPTTLFLLSLGAGAVGINLTAANRIFLLEPSFNPAVEAQAIGRVHRLGQKRPVVITRLIMNDSVESRMRQVLKDKFGDLKADDAMVGGINNDKATIFKQEFDLLYGIRNGESEANHPEPASAGSATTVSSESMVDEEMGDEADL
jgi:SNF2 family DNA or RNA helicase